MVAGLIAAALAVVGSVIFVLITEFKQCTKLIRTTKMSKSIKVMLITYLIAGAISGIVMFVVGL